MTSSDFADKLEAIAADIGDVPRHELAVLLPRAAIRTRSKPVALDDETGAALEKFAAEFELSRPDALSRIVQEALMAARYLAHHDLDEEYERGA